MTAEFASGCVGGSIGILATHPIDTVRVRMQNAARLSPGVTYATILSQMRDTIGLRGSFRGVLPPVVFRGVAMGFNRVGYSAAERFFTHSRNGRKMKPLKGIELAAAGSFSGLCGFMGDHPLYLLKCKAQTTADLHFPETFASYGRMAAAITKREGIRGWTKGFVPGVLFATTTYPIFYLLYDALRSAEYSSVCAGSAAAVLSWPIGLPFDTMRVQMQSSDQPMRFSLVARQMLRRPMKSWFVALGATMVRAASRYGICMWSIEQSNYYCKRQD